LPLGKTRYFFFFIAEVLKKYTETTFSFNADVQHSFTLAGRSELRYLNMGSKTLKMNFKVPVLQNLTMPQIK